MPPGPAPPPSAAIFSPTKKRSSSCRSYYAIPEAQRRRLFDLARVLSDVA